MINKKELKYIILTGIFAFVWFIYALPYIVKTYDGRSPVQQFLIFNLGLYIFFFVFLKTITLSTRFSFKNSLGLLLLFLSLDIWLPEYHVSSQGLLTKGADLGVSTTDYFFGITGQGFGISGFLLYLFVYLLVPVILLFISAKLIPNFVKSL